MGRMFACHAFLPSHKIYANRIMEYMCLRVSGSAEPFFFGGGGEEVFEGGDDFFEGWGVASFVKGVASRFRGVGMRFLLQVVDRGVGGGSGRGVLLKSVSLSGRRKEVSCKWSGAMGW
jgi:hypothetical protein